MLNEIKTNEIKTNKVSLTCGLQKQNKNSATTTELEQNTDWQLPEVKIRGEQRCSKGTNFQL